MEKVFYFIFTVNFDGKTISYNKALFMYDDDEVKGKSFIFDEHGKCL